MIDRLVTSSIRELQRVASWWVFAGDWRQSRKRLERLQAAARVPRGTIVEHQHLGAVVAELVQVDNGRSDRTTLLYLHGGGYTAGSPRTHRAFVARFAAAVGAVAYVPEYRLAPEHPFPAAHDDAVACYRAIADSADPQAPLIVAGDSAGGGLALAVAIAARDEGLRPPSAVVMFSPWLDLAERPGRGLREPTLTHRLTSAFADAYVPSREDRRDPRASPLRADVRELPPLYVESGTGDPLLPQAERLEHAARIAGVPVRHVRHDRLWHAFHLSPVPAAKRAIDSLALALEAGAVRCGDGVAAR